MTKWKEYLIITCTSILIIYASIGAVKVHADECAPLYHITDDQWDVLQQAYNTGEPYDLGNTMAAIAWTESTAGKYKVNLKSKDFGVMQNHIKTAVARRNVKGYYETNALITQLVVDDQLSMDLALEELLYWDKHTDSWANMVSAYNNGWQYKHATLYLDEIRKSTHMMINCGQFNMFNEEEPMHEEAVGDLVASFNNNSLALEPKIVGSYTGKLHNERSGVANSRQKPTSWEALKARLSRMWT